MYLPKADALGRVSPGQLAGRGLKHLLPELLMQLPKYRPAS